LAEDYKYYSSDNLFLIEDVPGAMMWSVSLENTMLTYFEVEPNSKFEEHSHISEQITYVLEGELFFEIAGKIIKVGPGEVIAVPSNANHAVYTKKKKVKAVDAWSPPADKYKTK